MNPTTLASVLKDYSAFFAVQAEGFQRLAEQVERREIAPDEAAKELDEIIDNITNYLPE